MQDGEVVTNIYSLKAIDQSPIGPKAHFLHDIFKGYEVLDVEVGLIVEVFSSRVEVDVETRSLIEPEMLDQGRAEGGLCIPPNQHVLGFTVFGT